MVEMKASHVMKEKSVKDLVNSINNARTLMIVNIRGLPSKQLQEIKKTIREHAFVKIAKKNIMLRTIKSLGKESSLPLEKHITENCAFAISDLEGFELAGVLMKNKNPIYAKAGQIAPEDIEVKAGPTNLLPGPAISELGALGIQIAVEDGKISIKEPRVVVNKGGEIKENAASLLQKLDIKPFTIGLEPVVVYDVKEGKIYTEINIDSEGTVSDLVGCAGKALGFAQKIVYICKDTIGYLLALGNSHSECLGKLESFEKSEEKSEDAEEKKEEVKGEKVEEAGKEEIKEEDETKGVKENE